MVFDKIILIGNGTIALDLLKNLLSFKPIAISYKPHHFSILEIFCQKNSITYQPFYQAPILKEYLQTFKQKTLIISANNNYIFPKEIIDKSNLRIINFHNALLPMHKGVNAPIWSIYEQDKFSGITWHMVIPELDSGSIIAQAKIELTPNITSLELIKALMELGVETFKNFQDILFQDRLELSLMPPSSIPAHKSKDLPNNGFLDISWEEDKISAFLRSMDTKGLLPKPKIHLSHHEYIIQDYGFEKIPEKKDCILLTKNNVYMLLSQMGGGASKKLSNLYLLEDCA